MTITELINNWCPRSPKSRTFLIRYSNGVFDKLCEFIWGNLDREYFYTFLESNTSLCIDHDFTTIRSNHFLSDKYINARVEHYTFYNNDLFILYEKGPKESKEP